MASFFNLGLGLRTPGIMRAFFCFAGATAEVVFFQPQAGVYQTAMAPALPSPVAYEPANFPQAVVVGGPQAARSGPGPVAAVLMGLVAGVAVSTYAKQQRKRRPRAQGYTAVRGTLRQ